ncbi:SMI1/KNR4 family protein [Kitasatospora sp. NPDC048407]|uniref:SMI1/KNR4 family protein n=1 Tax=Kitasatospora sp. NPDC048407 TaxID=3364051 RepID=UPI003722614A
MNSRIDWSSVRERVIAVEEAARRARGLAPSRHPTFEPVLTPDEIAEVEAQCGVELPADYRSFLAEVGVNGPGPWFELTSLRRVDGRWGWVWDDDETLRWLLDSSGPFVETEDWPTRQAEILRAAGYEPTPQGADDGSDFRRAFGRAGDERRYRERGRGAIHISNDGCGATGWLIVVGPHRGELRDREQGINPPFEPYVDAAGNRHTFGTWYLEWLERCESAAQ